MKTSTHHSLAARGSPQPFAYYGTARGASPNYTNRLALMSLADLLTFDSMAGAGGIKAPTLIVLR